MSLSFSLNGCTARQIEELTADDLFDQSFADELYDIPSMGEVQRVKALAIRRAKHLELENDFRSYLTSLEEEQDDYNGSEIFDHVTNFGLDGWNNLSCGKWIADSKGIRKKGLKVYASMTPIQPVELLENASSGIEKVKLQFYKNGQTKFLVVDRNSISSASNIVRLANEGIEVTSESAKNLVKYLSDIINFNIETIPYKTAFSQMGWHSGKFIPYDIDAVFDGEKDNRFLFRAFDSKGSFETWQQTTTECRKKLSIRLAMDAAFGSVILDKLKALPFVFHLWGKSGTGKTLALMIAMSAFGNPAAGATVRTLNMTENALIGQAAFLNSLPFAGDELQTIKDRSGNYDKLIMKATEGIERGRMIDGQKAAESKHWRCAFLFTGEDRCTRPNSGAGVKNRCIEFPVEQPLFEGSDGNKVAAVISSNYGHAGRLFVDFLKKKDDGSLLSEFHNLTVEISEKAETETKQASAMAVLMLADKLVSELFYPDETPLEVETVIPYLSKSEEIDIAERAFEFTVDMIAANYNRFGYREENRSEIWGGFKNGKLYFNSTILKSILQKEGFEFSSVSRTWADKGYLERAKDGKFTVGTYVDEIKARYVVLNIPEPEPEPDPESEGFDNYGL